MTNLTADEIKALSDSAFRRGNPEEGDIYLRQYRKLTFGQAAIREAARVEARQAAIAEGAALLPKTKYSTGNPYQQALIAIKGGIARPVICYSKTKRDDTQKVMAMLKLNGYELTLGNDALNGSTAGNWITVQPAI
jgi:hypothetical protein